MSNSDFPESKGERGLMKEITISRPSPAILVAVLALVAAVAGTAVASDPVATTAVTKKKVKKIAKKQAKKYFNANIGGASVAHADSADNATSAETANSANPIAFARVRTNGTVDASRSKNVTSSNVTLESAAAYCFRGLDFAFRGAVVTPDFAAGANSRWTAQFALGNPFGDCGGPNVQAEVATSDATDFEPTGFFIMFYN